MIGLNDTMQRLLGRVRRWGDRWARHLRADRPTAAASPPLPDAYHRLEKVIITDQVQATLFDDFAHHRSTSRGQEEIGWLLLGLREERHAVALAALPAGVHRQASLTHIFFNSDAQAPASRLLRQRDRRLVPLGVVHTHPGSLRHPSGGDYRGDIRWVEQLRGKEGVFAIGTADAEDRSNRSEPHQQVRGPLGYTWYALARGDLHYRRLPVEVTIGPDLARPLLPLWPTLERHALGLERLCKQQAGVRLEVVGAENEAALAVLVPLAQDRQQLRLLLQGDQVRYYVEDGSALAEVDPGGASVDHGVYLILAELARRQAVRAGAVTG